MGSRNLDDQARLGWRKSEDFDVVLRAIEANPISSIWRVSGGVGISQIITKVFWAAELWFTLPKYCKTFDSSCKTRKEITKFDINRKKFEKEKLIILFCLVSFFFFFFFFFFLRFSYKWNRLIILQTIVSPSRFPFLQVVYFQNILLSIRSLKNVDSFCLFNLLLNTLKMQFLFA